MPVGVFRNPEERARKISEAKLRRKKELGYINSPEAREKIAASMKGKPGRHTQPHSAEARAKMRAAKLGKPSPMLGKKHREDTKRKISDAKKSTLRGEENPNFKNGRYTLENRRRSWHYTKSLDYRDWRKAVYERDGYTCQNCGQRGGYLTAHHVKSWAEHPELRYEIDNGQTLCEPCHQQVDNYKIHSKTRRAA
jgi:5-methylcytosine-specific restriction endonuclease McrA